MSYCNIDINLGLQPHRPIHGAIVLPARSSFVLSWLPLTLDGQRRSAAFSSGLASSTDEQIEAEDCVFVLLASGAN